MRLQPGAAAWRRVQIDRRAVTTSPPLRIKYTLTKLGTDVIPVMYAAAAFSMKNFPEEVFEDGKSRTPLHVAREIRESTPRSV